jgi:hypothetical protein
MQEELRNQFKFDELWDVFMSNQREPYQLNEMEYAVFQDALLKGIKGIVHFEKFALNTTYFVSSVRTKRTIKEGFQLTAPEEKKELTPEEREKAREKLIQVRESLGVKLGW